MDMTRPLTVLKEFRERHEPPLTQEALGALIGGVSKETVSRWENGRRKPEPERVPKISRVTGIPRHKIRPDLYEPAEAAE